VLFSNALFWPVTINLNVPKSAVNTYPIGAGSSSQAPKEWGVTFYYA
jgi:hypothetical protein